MEVAVAGKIVSNFKAVSHLFSLSGSPVLILGKLQNRSPVPDCPNRFGLVAYIPPIHLLCL
jgi:hypothetical protein